MNIVNVVSGIIFALGIICIPMVVYSREYKPKKEKTLREQLYQTQKVRDDYKTQEE